MRALWFTNSLCNYKTHTNGYNGEGWITSLHESFLSFCPDIQLGVCFCMDGQPTKVEYKNTVYYPIPYHSKSIKDKVIDFLRYADETRDSILWPYYIKHFKQVIQDFQPDVIEIFGSEVYIGLASIAAKELNIPCCLHIQGLLSFYMEKLLPNGITKEAFIMKDGLKGAFANFQLLLYWRRSCYREKVLLKAVPHFIGRTTWDKQAVCILNPYAEYHYGGEIFRSCFYKTEERHLPKKTVIITTSSGASYKGFDIILNIAKILKQEMHIDFEWKVYGNVDYKFFERVTKINHNDVNVSLMGIIAAEELKGAMLNATVYVQPSYIENSPNSLAEAQILGVPVVATNVGGTSSMVQDNETGFLFHVTEPQKGADRITRLIEDKELNLSMGRNGQIVAKDRHNPKKIVEELLCTYDNVMKK